MYKTFWEVFSEIEEALPVQYKSYWWSLKDEVKNDRVEEVCNALDNGEDEITTFANFYIGLGEEAEELNCIVSNMLGGMVS